MRKKPTVLRAERELNSRLVSKMVGVDRKQKLDPVDSMVVRAFDTTVSRRLAGLRTPQVDPSTGLVLDPVPPLAAERTGLEGLDVQEIHRHRYDGQYPGEPRSHFLGGSNDITFGDDDSEISERWERVKNHAMASNRQKTWREAYHQIGFVVDRLDLPDPIREDVSRVYANLREQEVSEAYSLERLLGLLTYVACRIHNCPRDFDEVKEAIDDLYDLSINKDNVTRDMVKAFNRGPVRFGIEESSGRRYLRTWNWVNGERLNHRSLGGL